MNESPVEQEEVLQQLKSQYQEGLLQIENVQHLVDKAAIYWPIILPILKENGIPEDFKYLPLIESGFNMQAENQGAAGPWQFIKNTAKALGLKKSNQIDERMHIIKSTQAACAYLNKAHRRLGTWTLAAASYNCGVEKIKQRRQEQSKRGFYELKLNSITSNYIYRMVAVKHIIEHRQLYGVNPPEHAKYTLYRWDTDTAHIDLDMLAEEHDLPTHLLRQLNAWMLYGHLVNPKREMVTLILPAKQAPLGTVEL